MPLRIGDTFADYGILRLLGSGGMGEVYLAQQAQVYVVPVTYVAERAPGD